MQKISRVIKYVKYLRRGYPTDIAEIILKIIFKKPKKARRSPDFV
jgi:hypothetical protein